MPNWVKALREFEWISSLVNMGFGLGMGIWQYATYPNIPLAIAVGLMIAVMLMYGLDFIRRRMKDRGGFGVRFDNVSRDDLGESIRDSMDNLNLSVQKGNDSNAHFYFIGRSVSGNAIIHVKRPKDLENYILVYSVKAIGPNHKEMLQALPELVQAWVRDTTGAEIAGTDAALNMAWPDQVTAIKRIPLTRELTESEFFDAIDAVEQTMNVFQLKLNAMLIQAHLFVGSKQNTQDDQQQLAEESCPETDTDSSDCQSETQTHQDTPEDA